LRVTLFFRYFSLFAAAEPCRQSGHVRTPVDLGGMEPAPGKDLEFSEDETAKAPGVAPTSAETVNTAAPPTPVPSTPRQVPAVIDTADVPSARRQSIDKLLRSPTGALSALVIGAPSAANAGDIEQVQQHTAHQLMTQTPYECSLHYTLTVCACA
jgi:hypothetical protein